jgi:hypothetical protein
MGYSSWNDVGSAVTEDHIKSVAQGFVQKGFAAKGYIHINVNPEICWIPFFQSLGV